MGNEKVLNEKNYVKVVKNLQIRVSKLSKSF